MWYRREDCPSYLSYYETEQKRHVEKIYITINHSNTHKNGKKVWFYNNTDVSTNQISRQIGYDITQLTRMK